METTGLLQKRKRSEEDESPRKQRGAQDLSEMATITNSSTTAVLANKSPEQGTPGESNPDTPFHLMRLQSSLNTSQSIPGNSGKPTRPNAHITETTSQEKPPKERRLANKEVAKTKKNYPCPLSP